MLKHIGGARAPQHLRTPSGGSLRDHNEPVSTPVGRRYPPGRQHLLDSGRSSLSPTHSVSPGTTATTTTTAANNHQNSRTTTHLANSSRGLDESALSYHQPLYGNAAVVNNSSMFDRSLHQQSYLSNNGSASGNLVLNHHNNVSQHNKSGVTMSNGGTHIRRDPSAVMSPSSRHHSNHVSAAVLGSFIGVREMLTSLGLLCLLSLLMALLGLIFLFKMSPQPPDPTPQSMRLVGDPSEAANVYEVSLALGALAITLDVCCCLVCAGQLLLAARIVSATSGGSSYSSSRDRIKKFLSGSAVSRICAVAGFFVSIPIFLTDVVLYTILQFPSTPAITTSIVVCVGVVLCGFAMLHNIFVWQKRKRPNSGRFSSALSPELSVIHKPHHYPFHSSNAMLMSGHQMPAATLDLSVLNGGNNAINLSGSLELSTLV